MAADRKPHGERQQGEVVAFRAATGRHLIALTRDPALARPLQDLAGGDVTIHLVEDLRRLADELMQHGTAVALLDAQSLGVPVDAAVDAVKNQFPDVRLMVAGHATEQTLLASRISQQKVFRFVHKPASPQRLKLFLEAATSQHGSAGPSSTAELPTLSTPPPSRGGVSPTLIVAAIAVAALLAAGGWWMLRGDRNGGAGGATAASGRAAAPEVASLLARAAEALAAGRFVAADGSSAAELYREARKLDERSTAAGEGFERAIDGALASAEQSLLGGELEQARVTAEMLRLIVPDNARLDFLHKQIERELGRLQADTTQREAYESRQMQIRAAVAAVNERIASGALIEPAGESALARFREAQQVGGGDPQVRASRDALVGALLTAADREHTAGRAASARQLVDAAGSVNSSAPGLDIMRRRVTENAASPGSAPATASNVATPPETVATALPMVTTPDSLRAEPVAAVTGLAPVTTAAAGSTAAPGATGAGATNPANSEIISAASLRTLRKVDPIYPTQALQQLVSGWVDLEFTIEQDGSVRDIMVAQSEPGRTFDAAAIAAIKRYRFVPILRDGVAVEQRARMRMRFAAE